MTVYTITWAFVVFLDAAIVINGRINVYKTLLVTIK